MASQTEVGKAFEFAIATTAVNKIGSTHLIALQKDKSFEIAQHCFNLFDSKKQRDFLKASEDALDHIMEIEPFLSDPCLADNELVISLSKDFAGTKGDVRDVLFMRPDYNWEIGISAKNNHKAVKHSRLSERIDFGKEWTGYACSANYFSEIKPVFSELRALKSKKELWRNLEHKHKRFYLPVLNAFMKELKDIDKNNYTNVPSLLLKYLIGKQDFYKVIKKNKITEIHAFNINASLNKQTLKLKPKYKVAKLKLPSRIIEISFKKDSLDTLFLTLDEGWQISFRIHNASSKVEPSLKFDINLIGQPQILYNHHISR